MSAVEHCENCGRSIGKLEQPFVWRTHVVCAECHGRLSAPSAAQVPAPPPTRPPAAPPPLPPRQHYHPRVAPPRNAPPPAPVALRPDAPAPHPAPTLLCASCGHAYPYSESTSDHGKVICRTCSLAAAAHQANHAARDRRARSNTTSAIAAAAAIMLGVAVLGTYYVLHTRPDRPVAAATKAPPRAGGAEAIMARATTSQSLPQNPASADGAGDAPQSAAPALFPVPDSQPAAPAAATTTAVAGATPQPASASLAPAPIASTLSTPQASGPTGGAGAVAPDAPKPVPPPADASHATAKPRPAPAAPLGPPPEGTTERLVFDGRALLAQGKFQQALELFNQALKKDRNNADAWHGSGLCYQGMGNRDAAVERLEKAVTLYDPPSRAAVYNCAAANLRDNPMRAAKLVKDYLARDPQGQDEAMHTLLGRAVFAANRQARQNKYYAEVQQFYFSYLEQVNATRTDGRKRWGGEWVPASVATERWNRYRSLQQNVERLRVIVDHDTKAKTDAWDRFNDLRNAFRLKGEVELKQAKDRYEAAAKQEIASRQELKAAEVEFNSAEKPPFPQIVKPVPMEPMSPGSLLGK